MSQYTGTPFYAQQGAQSAQSDYAQLAQEEQMALAYLRSVQRRREAAEAAAALEARQRAHAEQQRAAALRAAAQRQQQLQAAARRERAIRDTLEREREREQALAAAIQQRRAEAIQKACASEQRRQQAAAQAYQREMAQQRQRQQMLQQKREQQQMLSQQHAQRTQQQQQQRQQISDQLAGQQAQLQAQLQAQAEQQRAQRGPANDDDIDGLNALLASMFGLELQPGCMSHPAARPAAAADKTAATSVSTGATAAPAGASLAGPHPAAPQSTTPLAPPPQESGWLDTKASHVGTQQQAAPEGGWLDTKASHVASAPAQQPAASASAQQPAASAPAQKKALSGSHTPKTPAEGDVDAAFPPELNALLNQFLGLHVDPAAAGEKGSASGAGAEQLVGNAVQDLNALLGQYGLEFIPDDDASRAIEERRSQAGTPGSSAKTPALDQQQSSTTASPVAKTAPVPISQDAAVGSHASAPASGADVHATATKPQATPQEQRRKGPDPEDTPFTSTLFNLHTIPPHMRDVLSHVEEAFAQESDDDEPAVPVAGQKYAPPAGAPPPAAVASANKAAAPAAAVAVAGAAVAAGAGADASHDGVAKTAPVPISQDAAIGSHATTTHPGTHAPVSISTASAAKALDADLAGPHATGPAQPPLTGATGTTEQLTGRHHRKARKEKRQLKAQRAEALNPAFAPRDKTETVSEEPSSPEAKAAIAELQKLDDQLAALNSQFTFPTNLGFAESRPDGSHPALLFNRTNSTYHAQAHALMQLLLAADGVQSGGDRAVRHRRKDFVRRVEQELQKLESQRDDRWDDIRRRRDEGESDGEDMYVPSSSDTEHTSRV